jgi:hypothetical protein
LTKDLVDQAIPECAGLNLVDGFVVDNAGNLSPQIDCMLVKGTGERIPYTESYKWHIKDVIAVFEVKKNLYGADLEDSYHKLRAVSEAYWAFVEGGGANDTDVTLAVKSFADLTGFYSPSREAVGELGDALAMIYHHLIIEQLSPIRVIFGYDGYVDEYALRAGFSKYMEQNVGQRGFGIASLPQLIVCGRNPIVKLNGQPYTARMNGDWWPVLASNAENPLRLLLELIWTRLSVLIGMDMPPEDSLQQETLHRLLSAKFQRLQDKAGWHFDYSAFSRERLQSESLPWLWEPTIIGQHEFVLLHQLAKQGPIEADDPDLLKWRDAENVNLDLLIGRLIEARFIARSVPS